MVPPVAEVVAVVDDKWGDPPLPRDYQLLSPWTQQLLRLARSGKVGTKRKAGSNNTDEDKPEDNGNEASKIAFDDRGYLAKKWKPVPEQQLEPEHKHFEFLAKRRKGLPSLGTELQGGPIAMRKTKVQRIGPEGEVTVYDVLLPVGQTIEGEITEPAQLADVVPVFAAPGTVIEGLGVANEAGIIVAEPLHNAPRRNRPPPKKKGGPGRGKKRVTFTNPDGSTYTTIVPNATKIVPQPGQTVKHVAKGEEASEDVSAEQAAAAAAAQQDNSQEDGGDDEGSGDDDGDDDGEEDDDGDDDDREEGELTDDDAPTGPTTNAAAAESRSVPQIPAKPSLTEASNHTTATSDSKPEEDVEMSEAPGESTIETPNEGADESMMDEDTYSPELLPEEPADDYEPTDDLVMEPTIAPTTGGADGPIAAPITETVTEPSTEPATDVNTVLTAPPDAIAIEVTIEEPPVPTVEPATASEAPVETAIVEAPSVDKGSIEQPPSTVTHDDNAALDHPESAASLADQSPVEPIEEHASKDVQEEPPVATPAVETTAEATAETTSEPPVEPTASSAIETAAETRAESALPPTAESAVEPVTESIAEAAADSTTETAAEAPAGPAAESTAQPVEPSAGQQPEEKAPPTDPVQATSSEETKSDSLPTEIPPATAVSIAEAPEAPDAVTAAEPVAAPEPTEAEAQEPATEAEGQPATAEEPTPAPQTVAAEAEEDLLGDLEKHLEE
jgi:hypothetical protein